MVSTTGTFPHLVLSVVVNNKNSEIRQNHAHVNAPEVKNGATIPKVLAAFTVIQNFQFIQHNTWQRQHL